jgi:branched-chain amino acid transport system permease protein
MQAGKIKYGIILLLATVVPLLISNTYFTYLLFLSCVFAILALSANIIFGGIGQFTFGHQAFFGIGAYTSGKLALSLGVNPLVGFAAAFALSGISGLLVGYVCMRRLRGMYLALVTFGLGAMLFLIARNWYEFTGGLSGLVGLPIPDLFGFQFDTDLSYYYLSLAMLSLTMYFIDRLWRSRLGRAMIALRESEAVASSIGIPPSFYYTLGFGIACGLAGLSGALYVHSMAVVNPMLFHFRYMIIILIAVLVGGMGTQEGPVFGAIIYVLLSELLRFGEAFRYVIMGIILLVFIIFMPRGLYPSLLSVWGRFGSLVRGREAS